MRKKVSLLLVLALVFSILPMSVSASLNVSFWNALWSVVENVRFQVEAENEEAENEEQGTASYSTADDIASSLAEDFENFLPGVTDEGAREQAARRYVIDNFVLEGLNVDITGNIATWSIVTAD